MTKRFKATISCPKGTWRDELPWITGLSATLDAVYASASARNAPITLKRNSLTADLYQMRQWPARVMRPDLVLNIERDDIIPPDAADTTPDGRERIFEARLTLCHRWLGHVNPWKYWEDAAFIDLEAPGLLGLFEAAACAAYDMHAKLGEAFTPEPIDSPAKVTARLPTVRVQMSKARDAGNLFTSVLFPRGKGYYTSPTRPDMGYFLKLDIYVDTRTDTAAGIERMLEKNKTRLRRPSPARES